MNEIKFYRVNDPYGYFSNFSPHVIFIDNERWRTVEHYFQASKFNDFDVKQRIQKIESPMQAAVEGRDRRNVLREDWELVKDDIMYKALTHKFTQHPQLMHNLIQTKGSLIIEHTKNDSYWADGGDGSGLNKLGVLLMKLRDELLTHVDGDSVVLPVWMAFPSISRYDLFWGMGIGEDYLMKWSAYYSTTNKAEYRAKYPEPTEWEGFYG